MDVFMNAFLTILMLLLLLVGFLWLRFQGSLQKTRLAKGVKRAWRKEVITELGLVDVVGRGRLLGVNLQRRALAIIGVNGSGKWIPYDAIAGVELTPFYSRIEEGGSETTTRRGTQLIGAGIGAAIAGPAGLVVGGLSGGSRTQTSSSSSDVLSSMELKLRLFSDVEPLLNLSFENEPDFNWETKTYEGGLDSLERIAARLATEIERRKARAKKPRFDTFETISTKAAPHADEGWWSSTFGS